MPKAALSILALALTLAAAAGEPAEEAPMLGFSTQQAAAQRELEARFDAQLEAGNLDRWMQRLAARPHHVGSPWGKANAELMAELFRSWGYEVAIEEFRVLFPTPRERLLEMVAPVPFTASLAEEPLAEDATSAQTDEQLPTFNAFSVDGDVTGELVYVHYGRPEDYEVLERNGVSVEGKIALARYGASWRGIKPKVAAEHGAVGCIIYSDPAEDGYGAGDVYPEGGYRPEQGAQRGSVADMPLYPGDPLTPFEGAVEGAERLEVEAAPTLTKIPVLPISYRDALPLLENLGGEVVPREWRGALPLAYHFGPGPARVHLKLAFDWDLASAYDVIARLPGSERPDEWIIRGNHHDAWVNGAADPVSGMVALLEEARGVAALVQEGWRPKRTIVYAAWDAEEPGLLGSTEWVEAHAAELAEKAAVYINTDGYGRGFFGAGGSHTLERLVNQVAAEVEDPYQGISLVRRARAAFIVGGPPEVREKAWAGADLPLEALGSGSDFTPFLQHLGIASLNVGFGGEGDYGQYHSIYDSYDHYTRFMDPDFRYGVALAQAAGRLVLRLADAPVLPLEPAGFSATVSGYVDEVMKLADDLRKETEEENRRIEEGIYAAVDDPLGERVVPEPEEEVPYLNFAPLQNALAKVKASVEGYEAAREARDGELPAAEQARLDGALMALERALTREEGLPGRPWYRHYVYAPGFYTGYGVKTLPAVREAIEERKWGEVGEQIEVTAGVLERFAAAVDQAAAVLAGE